MLERNDQEASLLARAKALGLHGMLAHWECYRDQAWLPELLEVEEEERQRRSQERRLKAARIGPFRPLSDFDWSFPRAIDRELIEELLRIDFVEDAGNVILVGPNGVGKTLIAQNLAYQAVLSGLTVRYTLASTLLNNLAAQENPRSFQRELKKAASPGLLVLDEVGYLSYAPRHADLLFEIVSRRHQSRSTVLTTNKPFSEWGEVFPNATSVVALVDRLIHRATLVKIDGDSYRRKEAKEREKQRQEKRRGARKSRKVKKKR